MFIAVMRARQSWKSQWKGGFAVESTPLWRRCLVLYTADLLMGSLYLLSFIRKFRTVEKTLTRISIRLTYGSVELEYHETVNFLLGSRRAQHVVLCMQEILHLICLRRGQCVCQVPASYEHARRLYVCWCFGHHIERCKLTIISPYYWKFWCRIVFGFV